MQLSLAFLIVAVFMRNSVEFPRFLLLNFVGGPVASWLVRSTPEQAVRVRVLASLHSGVTLRSPVPI